MLLCVVCAGAPQGGGHGLRLGDDGVDYTSSAAAQARGVAAAGAQPRREAVRGASTSVSFGSDAPEFSTSTAAATQRHEVAFEGRRAVNVQKTSFALGDDAVDFVSTRMAEEGLESRPQGTRYRPIAVTTGTAVAVPGSKPKASTKASWTMGSSEWAPETSASSSFRWPEGGGGNQRGTLSCVSCVCVSMCVCEVVCVCVCV